IFNGSPRGFLFAGGQFQTDRQSEPPLSPQTLLQAADDFAELTFLGVPVGAGRRMSIDRDGNGILDGDQPKPNAINLVQVFVWQHYLDFLGREPEAGEPWSNVLRNCADPFNFNPNNPSVGCDRITVSGAFFGSPEFKDKGGYTISFYRVSFNNLPEFSQFAPDLASVASATAAESNAKRAAFANNFAQRPEFKNQYPDAMGNSDYVNALMTGVRGQGYNLTSITTPDPANPDGPMRVTLTNT